MKVEYKLIVAAGSSVLTSHLNNYANEGWIAEGSHQVTHYVDKEGNDKFQYSQMIVRYMGEDNE